MTTGKLERSGTLGRIVRILAGIAFLALFIYTLTNYPRFVGLAVPNAPGMWLGVALCFYFLAEVLNVGFGLTWGRWPQLVVGVLALAAVVFDLSYYGNVWGPPLGLVIFLLLAYVTGHLGLSFFVAGISAAPG